MANKGHFDREFHLGGDNDAKLEVSCDSISNDLVKWKVTNIQITIETYDKRTSFIGKVDDMFFGNPLDLWTDLNNAVIMADNYEIKSPMPQIEIPLSHLNSIREFKMHVYPKHKFRLLRPNDTDLNIRFCRGDWHDNDSITLKQLKDTINHIYSLVERYNLEF